MFMQHSFLPLFSSPADCTRRLIRRALRSIATWCPHSALPFPPFSPHTAARFSFFFVSARGVVACRRCTAICALDSFTHISFPLLLPPLPSLRFPCSHVCNSLLPAVFVSVREPTYFGCGLTLVPVSLSLCVCVCRLCCFGRVVRCLCLFSKAAFAAALQRATPFVCSPPFKSLFVVSPVYSLPPSPSLFLFPFSPRLLSHFVLVVVVGFCLGFS